MKTCWSGVVLNSPHQGSVRKQQGSSALCGAQEQRRALAADVIAASMTSRIYSLPSVSTSAGNLRRLYRCRLLLDCRARAARQQRSLERSCTSKHCQHHHEEKRQEPKNEYA